MIDMRYHGLPDWTETVRNEPILSGTDIDYDTIKALKYSKLIMGHHIVACEEFYVHNNVVIYLERRKIVPEELLHPAYMYPSFNQISYSPDLIYITRRQVIQRSSQQIFRRGYETIHGLTQYLIYLVSKCTIHY